MAASGAGEAGHDRGEGVEQVVADHHVRHTPLFAAAHERVADVVDRPDQHAAGPERFVDVVGDLAAFATLFRYSVT